MTIQRISPKTGLILGAFVLLAGFTILNVRKLFTKEPIPQTVNALSVEAITVQPADSYTVSRVYTGEVAAGRTSELGFEQRGKLVEIRVDRGNFVNKGQPLAQLDTSRLEVQRSQRVAQRDRALAQLAELQNGSRREDIDAAQATVKNLEKQLELQRLRQQRREFLYTEGAISREDRDIITFGADALKEQLSAAKSQLEELQTGTRPEQIAAQQAVLQEISASIVDLDIAIKKNTIFAPFSGVIADRRLDEGTIVEAGQAVLRLIEQSQAEVEIGLPADVVADLRLGQSQSISIAGNYYNANVKAILPEVDPTTRTQTLVFRLNGVSNNTIVPEQLAEVEITRTMPTSGFLIPFTALVQGQQGLWAVYTLKQTDKSDNPNFFQVKRQEVELLHTEGEDAFVRGLVEAGDRIIKDGTQRLVPGQLVQFKKAGGAEGEKKYQNIK
ncbi:MAG: efflux RND transporter periplasmic adaptor subunit [Symploca sp. SIO2D2]|nr:efflux RND transporter periplasmic adaptor subunit [Symploca sp. SIO2D2]